METFREPKFPILPHPKAPLFNDPDKAQVLFKQLLSELASKNFSGSNQEFINLVRQAGFVNLWFFLKGILGVSGPYNKLNTALHLEMCNWRQSPYCMDPTTKSAIFIPRGHYKSTICTHGADTWELLRNPDLRIGLTNAKIDKAEQFKAIIHRTFDSNEFFAALYPEYVIKKGRSKLILPNRSRFYSEPSVKCISPGSASEGDHYDLFDADDLIGDSDIDQERRTNTNMDSKIEWFKTSERALVDSWKTFRINLKGTFWASDDLYSELILKNCKEFLGYENSDFTVNPKGTWSIYYRTILENDEIIFPENFTKAGYEDMLENSFWVAMTQYANNPLKSGLTEFGELELKKSQLQWNANQGKYFIYCEGDSNFDEEERLIPLDTCDVVMSVDPAGTDKKEATLKHSKSAIQVWAMDEDGNCYLIWSKYGNYGILKVFEFIFEGAKIFQGYMRCCILEGNAFQKVLKPLLRAECERRDQYVLFKPIAALIDKVVRIRNTWAPKMMRGKIYLCTGTGIGIKEEKNIFPQSPRKLDALDCGEKALAFMKPIPRYIPGEYNADDAMIGEESYMLGRNVTTGY